MSTGFEVSTDRLTSTCMDLASALAQVKQLRHDRDREIVCLLNKGFTTDQVADLANLTQPRVVQIKHDSRG